MALKKKCSHFYTQPYSTKHRKQWSISTISVDPLNNSHKCTQPYYTFNSLVHSKKSATPNPTISLTITSFSAHLRPHKPIQSHLYINTLIL
jgi:hypothetical protein